LRRYFNILLLGNLLLWLAACNNSPAPSKTQIAGINQYFDVTGFMQQQITQLNREKPGATEKVTEAGRGTETKQVNNLDWDEELGVFLELDINKPAFRNAYIISHQTDPGTGLTSLIYRKKPGTDGNVQYLVISTDAGGQVKAIRGLQETSNVLLTTRRELQLQCNTKNGVNRVTSYSIQGLQKPVIFQALRYVIVTELS